MTRKREIKSKTGELFAAFEADQKEASVDDIVAEQKGMAKERVSQLLGTDGPQAFANVAEALMQAFMLRETNIKDVCVDLAREGKIHNSWGGGNRKPSDDTIIAAVAVV
jgi:hypothetical protein